MLVALNYYKNSKIITDQIIEEICNDADLKKNDEIIDEIVGNSANNNDWKILQFKNHVLEKDYSKIYDNIKLDINYDK